MKIKEITEMLFPSKSEWEEWDFVLKTYYILRIVVVTILIVVAILTTK